jgi:uncharacterized protein (TIGR01627 family)
VSTVAVDDAALRTLVAGNPGQGTFEEYRYLREVIRAKAPCRLLVFGVGKDSALWIAANEGGTTEFVEHEREWIAATRDAVPGVVVHEVHYETRRKHWKKALDRPEALLMTDLPKPVLDGPWDILYVDSPQGGNDRRPGRMKSIYTAARIAERCPADVDVLLHDCDREVERVYGDRFLGAERLVEQVGRTRHYRPRQ